jgi:hypothetical protein
MTTRETLARRLGRLQIRSIICGISDMACHGATHTCVALQEPAARLLRRAKGDIRNVSSLQTGSSPSDFALSIQTGNSR